MGALQNLVGKGVGFIVKNTATKKLSNREKIESITLSMFESLIGEKGALLLFHGSYYVNKMFVRSDLLITHIEADVRNMSGCSEVSNVIKRVADFSKSSGLCCNYSFDNSDTFPMCVFRAFDDYKQEICRIVIDQVYSINDVETGKWSKYHIIGYNLERSFAELYVNVSSGLWEYREEDLYLLYSLTEKYDIDLGKVYSCIRESDISVISGYANALRNYMQQSAYEYCTWNESDLEVPRVSDMVDRFEVITQGLIHEYPLVWKHEEKLLNRRGY